MKARHLKLVAFDSSDFSLGEALAKSHGTFLKTAEEVSRAFSLLFQWPEYAHCYLRDRSTLVGSECTLDYDRDEREPSELRIKLKDKNLHLAVGTDVVIRFEVFYVAYSFSSKIIHAEPIDSLQTFDIVASVPKSLHVEKLRRAPRLLLTEEHRAKLKEIFWILDGSRYALVALEMGVQSLKVAKFAAETNAKGTLEISGKQFAAHIVRSDLETTVLQLDFADGLQSGEYFDIYKQFRYPCIRNKYDYPPEEGIRAYVESGFFEKYSESVSQEELEQRYSELKLVWKELATGLHKTTVDQYAIDLKGTVTGASSLVLGFYDDELPLWVFHQLCTITRPEFIEQTHELYTWRIEYLSARPEKLDVSVWFDGKSRWMERIWVKFSRQFESKQVLTPIQMRIMKIKNTIDSNPHERTVRVFRYKIGNTFRASIRLKGNLAAAGPALLNVSKNLDRIILTPPYLSFEQIQKVGLQLLQELMTDSMDVRIALPLDFSHPQTDSLPLHPSNRFCRFSKVELLSLLASLEHSLAVMKRKLENVI